MSSPSVGRSVLGYVLNELLLIVIAVILLVAGFMAIFSHNAIVAGVLFFVGAVYYPVGVYLKGKIAT